jgi:hypothetical protein
MLFHLDVSPAHGAQYFPKGRKNSRNSECAQPNQHAQYWNSESRKNNIHNRDDQGIPGKHSQIAGDWNARLGRPCLRRRRTCDRCHCALKPAKIDPSQHRSNQHSRPDANRKNETCTHRHQSPHDQRESGDSPLRQFILRRAGRLHQSPRETRRRTSRTPA